MSVKQVILAYLAGHAGSTVVEIAKGTGIPARTVSPSTTLLFQKGRVERTVHQLSASNNPSYAYSLSAVKIEETKPRRHVKSGQSWRKVDTSLSAMLNHIAADIAQQIVGRVKDHIALELTSLIPEVRAGDQTPEVRAGDQILETLISNAAKPSVDELRCRAAATLPAPRLKRVLVCGLMPQQAGLIQNEFNDCLDVRFWNDSTGDGPDSLKGLCKSSEAVFLHTNHSSHRVDTTIRQHAPRFVRVTGGMTQMREALTEFYAEAA